MSRIVANPSDVAVESTDSMDTTVTASRVDFSSIRRQLAPIALVLVLLVAALSVIVIGVEPVLANNDEVPVEGTVELDASGPDDDFEAGSEAILEVEITNNGEVISPGTHPVEVRDRATEARSSTANITDAPDEIDIRSGPQNTGTIDSGQTVTETFEIFVDDDAQPGEYDLELTVDYTNVTVTDYEETENGDVNIEEETADESQVLTVTITVADEPRFDILDVDHNVQIDETGNMTIEMENTGTEDVSNVVVTAEATDAEIFFGSGTATSERWVGDWDAGQTHELRYRTGATDEATTEPYPIGLTIEYDDSDGTAQTATEETSLTPMERQQYSVDDPDHNVSIGDDGLMELEVTNNGPQDITNASITVATNDPAITFGEATGDSTTTQTFVGDFEAGETETLVLRVAVAEDAIEREYTMEATISGRDTNDTQLNDRTREFGFRPHPKQLYTVENVSHNVVIGDSGRMEIELQNRGPQNVTNASVIIDTGDSALTFEDGSTATQTFVDEWAVGETKTLTQRVGASGDAVERNYTLTATITAKDENDSDLGERTREFGLQPAPEQRYTIDSVTHDVAVNDEGIVEIEMTNRGPLNVTDASVELNANDPVITFGSGAAGEAVEIGDQAFEAGGAGSPTSEAYLGDWAVNETKTIAYHVSADGDALTRQYTLDATVSARNQDDDQLTDRTRSFGFEPQEKQRFAIENQVNTLRVGEEGDVVGTVTNDANRTAKNVVVRLAGDVPNFLPRDTQYAIGDLEPGETAEFHFRFGVSAEAEAGPRVLQFETRYRSTSGETRLDDSKDLFVEVLPKRDAFAVEPMDGTFEPGETETVEVEIENQRDEHVENVRAKIFPDSPISSDDDEAFVRALEPGETATMVFEVSVDSGAVPKEYPVKLDIRYDDERGDTQLSGTYQVPIDVTESNDSGPSPLVIGGLVLVVGGLAFYFRDPLLARVAQVLDGVR